MKFLILLIALTVFLMATVHGVDPTEQMATEKIPPPLVFNDICKYCCKFHFDCEQILCKCD